MLFMLRWSRVMDCRYTVRSKGQWDRKYPGGGSLLACSNLLLAVGEGGRRKKTPAEYCTRSALCCAVRRPNLVPTDIHTRSPVAWLHKSVSVTRMTFHAIVGFVLWGSLSSTSLVTYVTSVVCQRVDSVMCNVKEIFTPYNSESYSFDTV